MIHFVYLTNTVENLVFSLFVGFYVIIFHCIIFHIAYYVSSLYPYVCSSCLSPPSYLTGTADIAKPATLFENVF